MGYQKDPLNNLGRLRDEMLRYVRLVVDTGLHSERWTREQAIAMMRETGMGEAETVTEIERYIVDPGQALAYKVGMLKILELRERARSALGSRFDIREFHDQVLLNGALPSRCWSAWSTTTSPIGAKPARPVIRQRQCPICEKIRA